MSNQPKRSRPFKAAPELKTREEFLFAYADVIAAIERHIATTPLLARQGWRDQLAGYSWGGKEAKWSDGVSSRLDNAARMRAYRDGHAEHQEVFHHIVYTWGGIRQPLKEGWEPRVRETLERLEEAPDQLDAAGLCGGRIASVSKLYAAMHLDTWVIYDSRVAAALTYLLSATGNQEAWGGHWGVLAGKNPKRLRMLPGFPRIYPGKAPFSNPRAMRSFVYASWLCQELARVLNDRQEGLPSGAEGPWQAYHVEMVLFMLGRDLHDLPALKEGKEEFSLVGAPIKIR